MSLVDPKNPARWCDGSLRSQGNGFTNGFGDPINWTIATVRAAAGPKISAAHERQRQEGKNPGAFYGLSRKSDESLQTRPKYSAPIEGREAGLLATEKRQRASKASI
jgi:hypothetical protein